MASHTAGLNIMELSKDITVTVKKFSRMREWTLRVKLGALLLRFALWVLPFGVDIDTDD